MIGAMLGTETISSLRAAADAVPETLATVRAAAEALPATLETVGGAANGIRNAAAGLEQSAASLGQAATLTANAATRVLYRLEDLFPTPEDTESTLREVKTAAQLGSIAFALIAIVSVFALTASTIALLTVREQQ